MASTIVYDPVFSFCCLAGWSTVLLIDIGYISLESRSIEAILNENNSFVAAEMANDSTGTLLTPPAWSSQMGNFRNKVEEISFLP